MSKIVDELIEEARIEEIRQIVLRIIKLDKLSFEEIALCSGLSVEEVKRLAERESA